MPELPEAETIARSLKDCAVGLTIRRVFVLRRDVIEGDVGRFRQGLRGRRIERVGRRGKNVVFELDGGMVLCVKLGMTGRLLFRYGLGWPADSWPRHVAVGFHLRPDATLIYDDVRRFGRLELLDAAAWAERSARLGPEPLEASFTAAALAQILAASRAPVRSLLLDQTRLAGIGNIYANEALFAARVHPARPAASLTRPEVGRLHRAIRAVLRRAIAARGTTIRDYRDPNHGAGDFAPRLRVYGREGSACPRCGCTIKRLVLAGRSTFLCPRCQPGKGWA